MESNWDKLKPRLNYHFDVNKHDPAYDSVRYVGKFEGDWTHELASTIADSEVATWRTRNPIENPNGNPDIESEELDLIRTGAPADLALTNMEYQLQPVFQKMTDTLGLTGGEKYPVPQSRVHVQHPGQVWNLHIDKLEKYSPQDPHNVYRFMVMLNDWEPGHFLQYGNYMHTGYKAGEIYCFDWYNVPHATANAGHGPRCMLLVTGVATDVTYKLLGKFDNRIQL